MCLMCFHVLCKLATGVQGCVVQATLSGGKVLSARMKMSHMENKAFHATGADWSSHMHSAQL